jgi:hypothetical protein
MDLSLKNPETNHKPKITKKQLKHVKQVVGVNIPNEVIEARMEKTRAIQSNNSIAIQLKKSMERQYQIRQWLLGLGDEPVEELGDEPVEELGDEPEAVPEK